MFPSAPQARRPTFRLAGFPVRVDPSFLLISLLLGWTADSTITQLVAWVVIVFVSVLVHELGHAVAARRVGAKPIIELYAMGGLTAYRPPRPLSRAEQILISLAGPMAGFVLGAAVLVATFALGGTTSRTHDFIVFAALWVNFGWGLFNLVPVLPLDGGTVMRNLLPGDEAARDQRAALLSAIIAGAAGVAIVVVAPRFVFGAIFFGILAVINVSALSKARARVPTGASLLPDPMTRLAAGDLSALGALHDQAQRTTDPLVRDAIKGAAVDQLVRLRRGSEAQDVLERFPGQAPPSLYALVEVLNGAPHGVTMLDEMLRDRPEPTVVRHALLGRVLSGRAHEIPTVFASLPEHLRDVDALREAQYLAHVSGAVRDAAHLGELVLASVPAGSDLWAMYNTACSWVRAGDHERALWWLRAAVDGGWRDAETLASDVDLQPLWPDPRFHELRARVAAAPR